MMPTVTAWSPVIAVLAAALAATYLHAERWSGRLRAPSWWRPWTMPALVGAATAAALWRAWGSLDPVTTIHDESAYLLQAAMLLRGRFAGPPAPIPEFFEQFHVFVTPVLAVRYPPGFALALAPGVLLGAPALMPVLLTGGTAAMLYALVRRIHSAPAGFLAWAIWALAPAGFRFRPMILSEHLTELLWLVEWWALLEWRARHRHRWLVLMGAIGGWCAITRPFTAIALAVPILAVVVPELWRRREWRGTLAAAAAAMAFVGLVPWQDAVVTGDWRLTPLTLYSQVYFPFDLPGFGLRTTPPRRPLPPDFQAFTEYFRPLHQDYVPAALPRVLEHRVERVARDVWGWRESGFLLLAIVGLVLGGGELLFGAATATVLLLLYLDFAHPIDWTVYYLEAHTVLAALAAVGAAGCIRALIPAIADGARRDAPQRATRAHVALVGIGLWAALLLLAAWNDWPGSVRGRAPRVTAFRAAIDTIHGPALVFVRYASFHNIHRELVTNPPDYPSARLWIARDRGADDARLLALAPGRTPYLYVEADDRLERLTPGGP